MDFRNVKANLVMDLCDRILGFVLACVFNALYCRIVESPNQVCLGFGTGILLRVAKTLFTTLIHNSRNDKKLGMSKKKSQVQHGQEANRKDPGKIVVVFDSVDIVAPFKAFNAISCFITIGHTNTDVTIAHYPLAAAKDRPKKAE